MGVKAGGRERSRCADADRARDEDASAQGRIRSAGGTVLKWRGAAVPPDAGKASRAIGIAGKKTGVGPKDSPRPGSERRSPGRDSGLGAGGAGSFERHSHGSVGGVAIPSAEGSKAAGRPESWSRSVVPVVTQQQTVQGRFRQHARVPSPVAGPETEADAPLTIESIATTATRATSESRKRWRRSIMGNRSKLPMLPAS